MRVKVMWSLVALSACFSLALGLFPYGGEHGLFCDDYIQKAWAFDWNDGGWRWQPQPIHAHFRYLHSVLAPNLVNAIPEHEFLLRLFWVLLHTANALLLGWLAYRLTHSSLAGVGSFWIMLMPLAAHEVLLWHAASVPYLPALLAYLSAAHLILSSEQRPWLLMPAGLLASSIPLWCESPVFLVLLFPVLAWIRSGRRRWFVQVLWLTLAVGIVYAFYGGFVLRHGDTVSDRGGLLLNPLLIAKVRLPQILRNAAGLLWLWNVGGTYGRAAILLGWHTWQSINWGWLMLGIWTGSLSGAVGLWPHGMPASKANAWKLALSGGMCAD